MLRGPGVQRLLAGIGKPRAAAVQVAIAQHTGVQQQEGEGGDGLIGVRLQSNRYIGGNACST